MNSDVQANETERGTTAELHYRSKRGVLASAVVVSVAVVAWKLQAIHSHASDFAQVWYAARALLAGGNPYDIVGAGRTFQWPFPLLYPLTAVITAVPFAAIPLRWADAVWTVIGGGALLWALTRDRLWTPRLWVFASLAYFEAVHLAQWSPLLTAAALMPSLGFLLAAKPTLGAALFAAFPSRGALVGTFVIIAASIAIFPSWPAFWLRSLHATGHMSAPVMHLRAGGPLLLLALIKWRRPEARLVAALACVPQTTLLYEAVPLFLVVNRGYEGLGLAILTIVAGLWPVPPQTADYNLSLWATGDVMVIGLYLPCLLVVLTRPNHHESWDALVTQCRRMQWRAGRAGRGAPLVGSAT